MKYLKYQSMPNSKSEFQRLAILASLSNPKSIKYGLSECYSTFRGYNNNCDDNHNIIRIINESLCGHVNYIDRFDDFFNINIVEAYSIITNNFSKMINIGESGLSMRMLPFICALPRFGGKFKFVTSGSLKNRPMDMVTGSLNKMGIKYMSNNNYSFSETKDILKSGEYLMDGILKSGEYEIDGSMSSQHITGMLIAFPLLEGDSILKIRNVKSKSYILMTIENISLFCKNNIFEIEYINKDMIIKIKGNQEYNHTDCYLEGDWSNAAFFLVAAAISDDINLRIDNLKFHSLQPDRKIIDILIECGANVKNTILDDGTEILHVNNKNQLKSFEFDATDNPDLFPPLIILASGCEGVSKIYGIDRLKNKESNRLETLLNFNGFVSDMTINEDKNYIQIEKKRPINLEFCKGGHGGINLNNDHRMIMTAEFIQKIYKTRMPCLHTSGIEKSYINFYKDINDVFAM